MKRALPLAICIAAALAWTGCGIGLKVGPDYERPIEELSMADSFTQAGIDTLLARVDVRWWAVFRDPELDTLVDEAIAHNLDIRRASFVVLELRARNAQARAGRLPSINLSGDYQKQELPETSLGPGMSTGGSTESYNASICLLYTSPSPRDRS